MQRSQSCNPLNLRPRLNKEDQFQTNLILISQSQFNKEQQLKKPKKTIVIFKISGKSQRKLIKKNNLKTLSQIKQIAIKKIRIKFERKIQYKGMKQKRNSNLINYFKKSFQILKKGIGKKI